MTILADTPVGRRLFASADLFANLTRRYGRPDWNIHEVMIDKAHTLPREKVGEPFGRLDDGAMLEITRALSVFLGIA